MAEDRKAELEREIAAIRRELAEFVFEPNYKLAILHVPRLDRPNKSTVVLDPTTSFAWHMVAVGDTPIPQVVLPEKLLTPREKDDHFDCIIVVVVATCKSCVQEASEQQPKRLQLQFGFERLDRPFKYFLDCMVDASYCKAIGKVPQDEAELATHKRKLLAFTEEQADYVYKAGIPKANLEQAKHAHKHWNEGRVDEGNKALAHPGTMRSKFTTRNKEGVDLVFRTNTRQALRLAEMLPEQYSVVTDKSLAEVSSDQEMVNVNLKHVIVSPMNHTYVNRNKFAEENIQEILAGALRHAAALGCKRVRIGMPLMPYSDQDDKEGRMRDTKEQVNKSAVDWPTN